MNQALSVYFVITAGTCLIKVELNGLICVATVFTLFPSVCDK